MTTPSPCRSWRRAVITVLAAVVAVLAVAAPVAAQSAPSSSDAEVELAERFAPVIMIKEQQHECDSEGEPYRPTNVDIVLGNAEIALRQVSGGNPVVTRGPTGADLFELGEGFYLDFPGNSLTPGCLYEQDFDKYAAVVPPTVYAHVVQQPDQPDLVFVQYWFYWYFNDWNNKHESDWEGITLKFEASSVEEALEREPVEVGYAQHEGGERADWDDDKLEREGDHPVVYSSAGSHASYFGSAVYLGRGASEGFGCDDTSGPSQRLGVDVVVLPDEVDDPSDPLAWIEFEGRWGERQHGSFNGPTGPAVKDRWLEPAPWFDGLRSTSVVIPAGDSFADDVIEVFCGAVEWGSSTLVSWTESPARVLVVALLGAVVARFLVGRTDWSNVGIDPIVHRRRAGQILRGAFRAYRAEPSVYMLFGLVYVPAAIVTGFLMGIVTYVPFVSSLASVADTSYGTSLVLTALVGSIANVAAFVFISAIVAEYLDQSRTGVHGAIEAIRSTWDARRRLVSAFLRSFVIVFALFASIVGAPLGIWFLVRYQFAPQAVMFDDCDGRRALARSSRLVRGRWLHTAIVCAALNLFVVATALVVALVLLVAVTSIPLWLFSALVSMVYALVVPLAGIALTLLYGDARAEEEGEAEVATDRHVEAST